MPNFDRWSVQDDSQCSPPYLVIERDGEKVKTIRFRPEVIAEMYGATVDRIDVQGGDVVATVR